MRLIHICPASWGANCYLLISGKQAFVFDPSISAEAILAQLTPENIELKGILLTHGHFDHVLSAEALRNQTGAPVMIHEADNDTLADPEGNAFKFFFGKDRVFRKADVLLRGGDILQLGDETIEVIHTPGHTKGCVCFRAGSILLTGDTLFAEGYGRLDLPGGSPEDMQNSLRLLATLDPSLKIYPGHGGDSTLGKALGKSGLIPEAIDYEH